MLKKTCRNSRVFDALRDRFFAALIAVIAAAFLVACEGSSPFKSDSPDTGDETTPTPTPTPMPTPTPDDSTPIPTPTHDETLPVILEFVADPLTIDAGDSSTLRWEVSDATSVEIDHGIGSVSLSGARSVSPASTTTYELTAHGPGGEAVATAQVTVNPAPRETISATVTYFDYNAANGWVTFRIVNNSGGATLESVAAHIVNRSNRANYYGPSYSNAPFLSSPIKSTKSYSSMSSGQTRYLQYSLSGKPAGVPCRATITLYTADDRGGSSATKTVNFDLPGGSINASLVYYFYDHSSWWVTFRITNTGGVPIESVSMHVTNRKTRTNYYGPGWTNSHFSPTPDGNTGDNVPVGSKRYIKIPLTGDPPAGTPCRAVFEFYSQDGLNGLTVTKTLDFTLT
jgi:hypothetical protein